jgi:hypothetical protein
MQWVFIARESANDTLIDSGRHRDIVDKNPDPARRMGRLHFRREPVNEPGVAVIVEVIEKILRSRMAGRNMERVPAPGAARCDPAFMPAAGWRAEKVVPAPVNRRWSVVPSNSAEVAYLLKLPIERLPPEGAGCSTVNYIFIV